MDGEASVETQSASSERHCHASGVEEHGSPQTNGENEQSLHSNASDISDATSLGQPASDLPSPISSTQPDHTERNVDEVHQPHDTPSPNQHEVRAEPSGNSGSSENVSNGNDAETAPDATDFGNAEQPDEETSPVQGEAKSNADEDATTPSGEKQLTDVDVDADVAAQSDAALSTADGDHETAESPTESHDLEETGNLEQPAGQAENESIPIAAENYCDSPATLSSNDEPQQEEVADDFEDIEKTVLSDHPTPVSTVSNAKDEQPAADNEDSDNAAIGGNDDKEGDSEQSATTPANDEQQAHQHDVKIYDDCKKSDDQERAIVSQQLQETEATPSGEHDHDQHAPIAAAEVDSENTSNEQQASPAAEHSADTLEAAAKVEHEHDLTTQVTPTGSDEPISILDSEKPAETPSDYDEQPAQTVVAQEDSEDQAKSDEDQPAAADTAAADTPSGNDDNDEQPAPTVAAHDSEDTGDRSAVVEHAENTAATPSANEDQPAITAITQDNSEDQSPVTAATTPGNDNDNDDQPAPNVAALTQDEDSNEVQSAKVVQKDAENTNTNDNQPAPTVAHGVDSEEVEHAENTAATPSGNDNDNDDQPTPSVAGQDDSEGQSAAVEQENADTAVTTPGNDDQPACVTGQDDSEEVEQEDANAAATPSGNEDQPAATVAVQVQAEDNLENTAATVCDDHLTEKESELDRLEKDNCDEHATLPPAALLRCAATVSDEHAGADAANLAQVETEPEGRQSAETPCDTRELPQLESAASLHDDDSDHPVPEPPAPTRSDTNELDLANASERNTEQRAASPETNETLQSIEEPSTLPATDSTQEVIADVIVHGRAAKQETIDKPLQSASVANDQPTEAQVEAEAEKAEVTTPESNKVLEDGQIVLQQELTDESKPNGTPDSISVAAPKQDDTAKPASPKRAEVSKQSPSHQPTESRAAEAANKTSTESKKSTLFYRRCCELL